MYIDSKNRIGYNQSSIRFKQNIQTLTDTSWIYNLRAVTFDWKDQQRQNDEGTMIGLIAEEVSELCPKLVWLDKEGKPEGVHYEWLGIPLPVELQKLRAEVNELKEKLVAS
ncbi:MAG: tail fiber domain-containing protein [Crenarchaeota archaeon]|nr:tail fiber domain-containing protein [Thermoproteota archaeon]